MKHLFTIAVLSVFALACGGKGGGGGGNTTSLESVPLALSGGFEDSTEELQKSIETLDPVLEWDSSRVRKVLHTFAFGSTVSESKIEEWGAMEASEAIAQMISFNAINPAFLEEGERNRYKTGTLTGLSMLWERQDDRYGISSWNGAAEVWIRASMDAHLNPVRQRMGLLETNDHMAVHLDSEVEGRQVFRYYDEIMETLASGAEYHEVLSVAALSAAVATQYNHRDNRFVDGRFKGNEDFAREYHQLFFGILGVDDPERHEKVSIVNTARALTDIQVEWVRDFGLPDTPTFGMEAHYPGDLEILGNNVSGGNAFDKIVHLSEEAIAHPESQQNLPVLLVSKLADPALGGERADRAREAWKDLPNKSVLALMRSYAASDAFFSPDRFIPWSVLERELIIANRLTLTQEERDRRRMVTGWELMQLDNAPFRPVHEVFGSLRGDEALESSHVFAKAWEDSTRGVWSFTHSRDEEARWNKDWSVEAPLDASGRYIVEAVGAWLWDRFIADGGKHYGAFERAQVMALLSSGRDYGLFFDEDHPEAIYTAEDLGGSAHQLRLRDLSVSLLALDSTDPDVRRRANERVGLAIAFIVMTPYMFAQEG